MSVKRALWMLSVYALASSAVFGQVAGLSFAMALVGLSAILSNREYLKKGEYGYNEFDDIAFTRWEFLPVIAGLATAVVALFTKGAGWYMVIATLSTVFFFVDLGIALPYLVSGGEKYKSLPVFFRDTLLLVFVWSFVRGKHPITLAEAAMYLTMMEIGVIWISKWSSLKPSARLVVRLMTMAYVFSLGRFTGLFGEYIWSFYAVENANALNVFLFATIILLFLENEDKIGAFVAKVRL